MAAECALCHGAKHVRTPKGWVRCSCALRSLEAGFIKPQIRGHDQVYPADYDKHPPYPLRDLFVGGGGVLNAANDLRMFDRMVWRSLVHHLRDRGEFTYDYLHSGRLVDIAFHRDKIEPPYDTILELVEPDLLILTLGAIEQKAPVLVESVTSLLINRPQYGRATWVFSHYAPQGIRTVYGEQLAVLLGKQQPVLGVKSAA